MDFLTPGQKIKKIRKELKMKQEDLASDTITRPFISMIEAGKRGLSHDTAEIIAEKFNTRAHSLNVELSIDADFILRTPSQDAELYCLEHLKVNNSLSSIMEVINISTKFELEPVKAKAYLNLGDFYFNNHDYTEAFSNYNIALDLYKNTSERELEPYLYKQLGVCKYKLLQLTDSLLYLERSYYYSRIYENTEMQRFLTYNMAVCYKKLNKIETALYYVGMYLSMCDKNKEFNVYAYANILKASCYEIQNNIDKALNIYINLVSEFTETQNPILGIIYNNLGSIYLKKDDYMKSLEYFNMAQKIRMDNDLPNLSHTIIEKSEVYIKQSFYNEAIMLIELGIETAYKYNDMEYLLKGKQLLVQIYTKLNDYEKLESTYLSMLDLLKDTNDYNKILEVHNALCIMYLDKNNIIKAKDYLLLSQNIIEKSYKPDYNGYI